MTPVTKILRRDDVELCVTDYGGDGPDVVLLHGLAGSAREFPPTAEALTGSFRVLLLDQRGHGRSTCRPSDLSRQAFVDDVAHVIETLSLGRSVALVGQSMGAHTALFTASTRPELVERLVMLEGHAAGHATGEESRKIGEYFHSWPSPFPTTEDARTFLGESPLAKAWIEDLEVVSGGLRPRFDPDIMEQAIAAVHVPRWEEWERLDVPTLAIFGEDGMFTEEQISELVRRRPSTQQVVIPRASHDAHLDSHEAWIAVLRESLS